MDEMEESADRERRRLIGEQIVEGYRRIPQTDEELADVMEAGIRSVDEELPWPVSPSTDT